MPSFILKRTTAAHTDFQILVRQLDHELWDELKEDQATYDQYNKVPDIQTAVVFTPVQNPRPAAVLNLLIIIPHISDWLKVFA